MELALTGARAETAAYGAKLKLDGSGRELAYSRLRATDATGRELKARLEVVSPSRLLVWVTDAHATYPVRIDPTFSDVDWVSMNSGLPGVDKTVYAMTADDSGNLYVGGDFTIAGSVFATNIAKWNGSTWSALGSGVSGRVNVLAVSGTNLYVGGNFTNAGGVTANYVAKWDGSAWSALGSGMGGGIYAGYAPQVMALAASETVLYAGGWFTTAGGVPAKSIAKWNGSSWSSLGSGMNNVVSALAVSGTTLYAGGYFTTAGGASANLVARWNGSSWSALGSGIGGQYPFVDALAVNGTTLYAGGYFTTAGGASAKYIAKWNGSSWSSLGSGIGGLNAPYVATLAMSGTNLYVGGTSRPRAECPPGT